MAETNKRVLLTVAQAAERAGVSESLIYKWTSEEKRLPHYRFGGRGKRGKVLIDTAELDAFMLAHRVDGEAADDVEQGDEQYIR